MGVITFNKVPSTRFGIEVASPPRYIIPEEDYTETHILGLNGDRLTRHGSFKNVKGSYGCTFLAGDLTKRIFGDVNGDGRVSAADASLLLRMIAGLEPEMVNNLTVADILAMDVDQDGEITEQDAAMILQSIVHSIELPDYEFGTSVYDKIANQISQWLHPYYTPKERKVLLNKRKISGVFEIDKDGYFRLEDSYTPAFYRKAFCKESITVENYWDQGGAFELPFICAAGKYYKIGEEWLDAMHNGQANYEIDGYTLPALHYWHGEEEDEAGYRDYYCLSNMSKYASRPLIRMFFDSNSFSANTRPTVGQVTFSAPRNTLNETEYVKVRFNMQNLDYSSPFALYLDFDTCKAYFVNKTKSQLDNAQHDESQLVYFARTAQITECNDRITTEFPFTRETGVLYSGINKIDVRFWGGGELYRFRNFEILPRWWTI